MNSGVVAGAGATPEADRAEAAPAPQADPAREIEGAAESPDLLAAVLSSLDEDKAEDVVVVDLRGKSAIADHMVVASGRSNRHVAAISEKLMDRLKAGRGRRPRAEGVENGDWALIDAGDVIVHVFRPEVREFYALEKMWGVQPPRPAAASGE